MKKRFFCLSVALILTTALACQDMDLSEFDSDIEVAEEETVSNGTDEKINKNFKLSDYDDSDDFDDYDESDDYDDLDDSYDYDDLDDYEDIEDNEGPEEPTLEDYTISDAKGEYVVIKSTIIRNGPATDFDKIGQLNDGESVSVTGESDNGWFRFSYDGKEAFANKQFFQDKASYDANQQAKKAEEEAKKQAEEEAKKQAEEDQKQTEEQAAQQQPSQNSSSFISRVVELCNEQRAANGIGPLTEDATLDSKAAIRAGETVTKFDHTRPDGSSCFSVLDDVEWSAVGENIAAGQPTPEEVVECWMNSDGHRANILNPSFNKIGVGYATGGDYGSYWVQLFTD